VLRTKPRIVAPVEPTKPAKRVAHFGVQPTDRFPALVKVRTALGTTLETNITAAECDELVNLLTVFLGKKEDDRV
jgi:hypothetical protein